MMMMNGEVLYMSVQINEDDKCIESKRVRERFF